MIVIDNIEEDEKGIVVYCSHDYGSDTVRFPFKDIKKDVLTNLPLWQIKLKKFIDNKYASVEDKESFFDQYKNTEI